MSLKRLICLCLVLLACAVPALAILGLGDIVYDPSNFEEAVQQLAEMERHYAQLVQTYRMIENQYEHMQRMAQQVPVNMAARYKALATPWTLPAATNTSGTAGGWTEPVDTGMNVGDGCLAAIHRLEQFGSAIGGLPVDQQSRIKSGYATVELTDGANLAALRTIGALRSNAAAVEAAIGNLESDSLSSDPAMNTEIAVLNKINAAHLIGVRSEQDTNKLLAALTEERLIDAKRQRDAEAQAFNEHIRFVTDAKAVMAAQAQNASSAMLAWRMP